MHVRMTYSIKCSCRCTFIYTFSRGWAGATGPFGSTGFPSGDLPPLPPAPAPDDEDFDPDDEDMSVAVPNELTGMALVKRELGGQVIAEYDE